MPVFLQETTPDDYSWLALVLAEAAYCSHAEGRVVAVEELA